MAGYMQKVHLLMLEKDHFWNIVNEVNMFSLTFSVTRY